LRNLARRQVRRCVFRICIEQQDHFFFHRPVIDDTRAAALSSRSNGNPDLAYSTAASYDGTEIWIRRDPGLKFTILLIA
jgi:hypothetical protein